MWDIWMLKSEGEAWIFRSMILIFPLVSRSCVRHQLLLTTYIFNLHESCSYCSNPHHQVENCPSFKQFSNFSYKQINTSFSSPNWSNYSDFSWQVHATRNYAPQIDKLCNPKYPQFDNQFSTSLCNYPAQQSSLEDVNAFREIIN